jgi:hypothetical protein
MGFFLFRGKLRAQAEANPGEKSRGSSRIYLLCRLFPLPAHDERALPKLPKSAANRL